MAARRPHKPQVGGSSPSPAILFGGRVSVVLATHSRPRAGLDGAHVVVANSRGVGTGNAAAFVGEERMKVRDVPAGWIFNDNGDLYVRLSRPATPKEVGVRLRRS